MVTEESRAENKLFPCFDAALLCSQLSDEGLCEIKKSNSLFLLYNNLGQLQYVALCQTLASAEALREIYSWL